ncbi:MAG: aspartate/glutamate racemase family protein [Myxococcota bacterium]
MSDAPAPLGVLDWGIGGLDVVRKLRRAGEHRPVLYASDAGAPPYGTLGDEALAARVSAVITALVGHGCRDVLVGCNAASTVLDHPALRVPAEVAVHGVIAPAVAEVLARRDTDVLVIGGARTIASAAYASALEPRGVRVRSRVAQPLSALIEAGVLQGPRLRACLDAILEPVRDATVLVSACTHYLAVESALREALPRLQHVVDPADALVRSRTPSPSCGNGGRDRFWTTGDPAASQRAAAAAFGMQTPFEAAGTRLPQPADA